MQKTLRSLTSALLLITCVASANDPAPKTKVATRGPNSLRQLVIPGFSALPLERKLLAYYLTEAIEAGRDIAWLQLNKNGLKIRHLFEQIMSKRSYLTWRERLAIENYYFQLVSNHGIYDANTNAKNLLKGFTPETFRSLLQRVGVDPARGNEVLPELFDPNFKPYKKAEPGGDLIADAGTNFYGPGVTHEKMEKLPPNLRFHPLSYPTLDANGDVYLDLFNKTGKFGEQLSRVDALLSIAAQYANPGEKRLIEQYRETIRTGDPEAALEADRIWVKLPAEDISFYIGFTESYSDPYEIRPTWQGFVLVHSQDAEAKAVSDRVRASAPDYEKKMPVDEEFKNLENANPPQSESAYLLHMAGGDSETYFLGVNLPNDNKIRETLGSKSYTVENLVSSLGEAPGTEFQQDELNEFVLPEYHDLLKRHGRARPKKLQVEFHEILGHGSGRDRVGVSSDTAFGDFYMRLEESRAEIASLYHMTDYQALKSNRLVPDEWSEANAKEFAQAVILNFFTSHLESYKNLKGRTTIRQAHQAGRQVILNHLLNEGALRINMSSENVPRIELASIETLRASMGRLWNREQRIKSTGDLAGLEKMMAELAIMTPDQIKWAESITAASDRLKRPEKSVVLNPFLNLVRDTDGKITDVQLEYANPRLRMNTLPVQELRRAENDRVRVGSCNAFGK